MYTFSGRLHDLTVFTQLGNHRNRIYIQAFIFKTVCFTYLTIMKYRQRKYFHCVTLENFLKIFIIFTLFYDVFKKAKRLHRSTMFSEFAICSIRLYFLTTEQRKRLDNITLNEKRESSKKSDWINNRSAWPLTLILINF